jgi:hypothetical protein
MSQPGGEGATSRAISGPLGPPAETSPLLPGTLVPAAAGVAVCQDCGAPISGNYCANCGQETIIEVPSVRQFAHELMDQYIAVEGKLGRTLRVLVTQPGQLTLDYVQGRRQRYVRPLKLYVSISVVFFGLLGLLPDDLANPFMKSEAPAQQSDASSSTSPAPAAETDQAQSEETAEQNTEQAAAEARTQAAAAAQSAAAPPPAAPAAPSPPGAPLDLKQQIQQEIDTDIKQGKQVAAGGDAISRHVNAEVKRRLGESKKRHGRDLPGLSSVEERRELREKLSDEAPYAMFFLLPYVALLLRWMYRKNEQRYGVHLLFSVHLHCFAFILLTLMFLPIPVLREALEAAGVLYTFLALRHVYGGSWKRTLWRMCLLWFFDFVAISATALSGVLSTVFNGTPP